jgi:hypothetical protein
VGLVNQRMTDKKNIVREEKRNHKTPHPAGENLPLHEQLPALRLSDYAFGGQYFLASPFQ